MSKRKEHEHRVWIHSPSSDDSLLASSTLSSLFPNDRLRSTLLLAGATPVCIRKRKCVCTLATTAGRQQPQRRQPTNRAIVVPNASLRQSPASPVPSTSKLQHGDPTLSARPLTCQICPLMATTESDASTNLQLSTWNTRSTAFLSTSPDGSRRLSRRQRPGDGIGYKGATTISTK